MTNLRFLDTNILLYAVSNDPTETKKHDRAVALIDAGNIALSVQVLQEFYVQATRTTRPDPLPHDIATGRILGLRQGDLSGFSFNLRSGKASDRM